MLFVSGFISLKSPYYIFCAFRLITSVNKDDVSEHFIILRKSEKIIL